MNKSILTDYMDQLIIEKNRIQGIHLREMFAKDAKRFHKMSLQYDGLLFDYSKNLIDENVISLLINIAKVSNIEKIRDQMFNGKKINITEDRAVLHTALRNNSGKSIIINGIDIEQSIKAVLVKMTNFSNAVRNGAYKVSGGKITDIVNIGIGGSDLGPRMATQALREYNDGPNIHFVANIDANELTDTLNKINPKTTLFIIASKTFKTPETILNAKIAQKWLQNSIKEKIESHFCAVSSNIDATRAFGIADERTFQLWDWVGGRFSVWSAIGLSVMISIGPLNFKKFLDGAHSADSHFAKAPLTKNIPIIMGLLGLWYRNVFDLPAQVIIPYDSRMSQFPNWLQQVDMESNGKSVLLSGERTELDTGPLIFGGTGTNSQHAFFQLLHQGTTICPCDFLIGIKGSQQIKNQEMLLSNCLAQSEALMNGRTLKEAGNNTNIVFEGNRPSNTFLYQELTPHTLGMLMSFYEHKIFVQGVLWNINSFDQWGVELGKQIACDIQSMIEEHSFSKINNSSTKGLLKYILKNIE